MKKVAIVGVGMTHFRKHLDDTVRGLSEKAVNAALVDAGVSAADIEQVFFANGAAGLITGQEMIRGQAALRFTGLAGKPITNVENACASSSTAFYLAVSMIQGGLIDVALVVGAEKLTHVDKAISIGAFGRAVDLQEELPAYLGQGSGSLFMDIYAAKTRDYMAASGATEQDFAHIVVKSRLAGSHNYRAQFRTTTTVEEVLGSRMISAPLTLPMCSAIGDGAAAVVLCSSAYLKKLTAARPVWVGGCTMVSGFGDSSQPVCAIRASRQVYEAAAVGPADLHVVELHDASAPAELIHYENLGLCASGEGPAFLRSGATGINGRVSVNPSGGLLSRGHPIGATGAAQIVELAEQLRGRSGARQRHDAKVALAENNGGQMGPDAAAAVATVLHV